VAILYSLSWIPYLVFWRILTIQPSDSSDIILQMWILSFTLVFNQAHIFFTECFLSLIYYMLTLCNLSKQTSKQ
jgi:hypothetical protein